MLPKSTKNHFNKIKLIIPIRDLSNLAINELINQFELINIFFVLLLINKQKLYNLIQLNLY